jgi:hypothetical protein
MIGLGFMLEDLNDNVIVVQKSTSKKKSFAIGEAFKPNTHTKKNK